MEELDAVYPEVELFDVRKNQELSREIREEACASVSVRFCVEAEDASGR